MDFVKACLMMDPAERFTCAQLLDHPFFDNFRDRFERELKARIAKEEAMYNKNGAGGAGAAAAAGAGIGGLPPPSTAAAAGGGAAGAYSSQGVSTQASTPTTAVPATQRSSSPLGGGGGGSISVGPSTPATNVSTLTSGLQGVAAPGAGAKKPKFTQPNVRCSCAVLSLRSSSTACSHSPCCRGDQMRAAPVRSGRHCMVCSRGRIFHH
jgi:serine/threonine protein kinase